jgi:hypothetical protein
MFKRRKLEKEEHHGWWQIRFQNLMFEVPYSSYFWWIGTFWTVESTIRGLLLKLVTTLIGQ